MGSGSSHGECLSTHRIFKRIDFISQMKQDVFFYREKIFFFSKGSSSNSGASRANANHRANQSNPTSSAYRAAVNNRSNQKNSNNSAYHSSRAGNK